MGSLLRYRIKNTSFQKDFEPPPKKYYERIQLLDTESNQHALKLYNTALHGEFHVNRNGENGPNFNQETYQNLVLTCQSIFDYNYSVYPSLHRHRFAKNVFSL